MGQPWLLAMYVASILDPHRYFAAGCNGVLAAKAPGKTGQLEPRIWILGEACAAEQPAKA